MIEAQNCKKRGSKQALLLLFNQKDSRYGLKRIISSNKLLFTHSIITSIALTFAQYQPPMKNKHLFLIFCATLLLGLLGRYSPWFKSDIIHTDLLRVDSTMIQRIAITVPKGAELLLEHGAEGWVASQDDFAVRTDDDAVAPILATLAQIRSMRIVHSQARDTLLLLPGQSIHVTVTLKNGREERFDIGCEILENNVEATFIEIDKHEGIYLVNKYLRRFFSLDIDDFRSKTILDINPEGLSALQISLPESDTSYFQKSDTSDFWISDRSAELVPRELVQQWLQLLLQLNGLPFATHADESRALEHLAASISLEFEKDETPVYVQLFENKLGYNGAANNGRAPLRQRTPAFLVQSSQNPFNFFALSDTALARGILRGLLE